jgi:four helix bundle protein
MKIHRFEDLIAWQKAQDLAVNIYHLFGDHTDFGFRKQICNAAVSISNNIAEGFDRDSKATFVHFLKISSGSSSEVKSMLYLAKRLNYISEETKLEHIEKCSEVSRIIRGLINSIKN